VPLALGLAMLAVVLAAGLYPNGGTVSAQSSSCPYGVCPSSSSAVPAWEYASILVVVAAAVIIGLLLVLRRRRRPPAEKVIPGGAGVAGPMPPSGPPPPYLETPEDVGHPPPTVMRPAGGGVAGAAAAPAAPEAVSDIDALMAELDKISADILKKAPKKPPQGKEAEEPVEDEEPSP